MLDGLVLACGGASCGCSRVGLGLVSDDLSALTHNHGRSQFKIHSTSSGKEPKKGLQFFSRRFLYTVFMLISQALGLDLNGKAPLTSKPPNVRCGRFERGSMLMCRGVPADLSQPSRAQAFTFVTCTLLMLTPLQKV